MKAVISNRIYLEVTREYKEFLHKTLTYSIPGYNPLDPPQIIKNIANVRNNLVSIPSGRVDLIPEGYEIVDKRLKIPVEFPEFNGKLRESQYEVWNQIDDCAIINAWVSWGKTFTALAIAKKLGQKTLVVCHTIPIRNQWVREVKKVFGFTPGIIGSGRFEIDTPIVVGNVQTLYRNIPKIKKQFGTVILDEMHHVSAPTFSRLIDTNYCRYKIGLSGTLKRKDGKHVVFSDYFGNNIFKPPKENYMTPSIDVVRTDIRFMDGAKIPWANRVTALTQNSDYVSLIALLGASYARMGHKVLIVSDRVAFLKTVARLIGDEAISITGEIPHEERDELLKLIASGEKKVLCGTQAIFSEGISENSLSCLILGTPIGGNEPLLTQLIGRVIREHPEKRNPKIVDIHLKGNTARRQASFRMGYYIKMGYSIREL